MASQVYPKWKKALRSGAANSTLDGTVKAQLIDTGNYTYSVAHEFLSDIPGGAKVGAPVTLTGKTFGDDGTFDADDILFLGVSGASVEGVLVYIDTGTAGTSRLVTLQDGVATPNGENISCTWDNGANKILG